MTELRRIVWDWEPVVAQLRTAEPVEGFLLQIACRPVAADRRTDGKLLLVVGCWIPRARRRLEVETHRERLAHRMSALYDDKIELLVVPWPAGDLPEDDEDSRLVDQALASLEAGASPDQVLPPLAYANPPNPMATLGPVDPEVLEQSRLCEGILDRLLFAELVRRGVKPLCQYTVLNYRLDIALPDKRVAADVDRWQPRTGRRPNEIRMRGAALEEEGWTYLTFAGAQIAHNPADCADRILRARPGRGPLPPSGGPLSIGSFQKSRQRNGRRPR